MKPKAISEKASEVTKAAVVADDPVTPEQRKEEPVVSVEPGKFSPEGVGTV